MTDLSRSVIFSNTDKQTMMEHCYVYVFS